MYVLPNFSKEIKANTGIQLLTKVALITGVSGQDGGYLAAYLLEKGYQVFGTSRNAEMNRFNNLRMLGIKPRVTCLSLNTLDRHEVKNIIEYCRPHEIYHLSG